MRPWPTGGWCTKKIVVVVVVVVAAAAVVAEMIAIAAITAVLFFRLNQPTNFPIVTTNNVRCSS